MVQIEIEVTEQLTSDNDGEAELSSILPSKLNSSFPQRFLTRLRLAVDGWRQYAVSDIMPAGMALALLYLTVLGLDNITSGYIYSQVGEEIQ